MEYIRLTAKHKFKGHEKRINGFVFLHDNEHVVSGSEDGTMRKWNCETGRLVGEPWEGEGKSIWSLALSPDEQTIACGREDGSVQRWNTNGEMSEGVWTGHSSLVRSVSWSPSGGHITSGSYDGTILIRNAESGEVEVGPIETKQGWVYSLSYSPLGERIASGGYKTICIWDSNTGELIVGPIKDLGTWVSSLAWSSDSSKIYAASGNCASVFDSGSGILLHRFEHDDDLHAVALSPKHNVLACAGFRGIAQLWDTESHQALGQRFSRRDSRVLCCMLFSRDGRYLAYGGDDKEITLWMVEEIAPQLQNVTKEESRSESPALSSILNVDATNLFARHGGDDSVEEGADNPYDNFFRSSKLSLTSPSPAPSRQRRPWNIFSYSSVLSPPVNESVRLQERLKHRFFAHRAPSNSLVPAPANDKQIGRTPEGKVGGKDEEHGKDVDLPNCAANIKPDTTERNDGKGKQQEGLPADPETPLPDDPCPLANLNNHDNKPWKLLMRTRGGHIKKKAPAKMKCAPTPAVIEAHAGSMSQPQVDPSSHAGHIHTLSQTMSGQSSEPFRPSAGYGPSHLSQCPHPSSARHMWDSLILFRHRKPENESIPLQQRSKRSFFSQPTGPRPVTVYAGRPRKLYWTAPRTVKPANQTAEQDNGNENANAQTVQSTSAAVLASAAVQPPTAHPDSRPYGLQSPQTQAATQPTLEEYNFGGWGNFCLALWCIRRPLASATQPPAS